VLPRLRDKGFDVHAVSRRAHQDAAGVSWHILDLSDHRRARDLVAAIRPSHLLHMAWDTHDDYYTSPANLLHLRDGVHLVHEFVRTGGTRVIGVGTAAEYDLSVTDDLVEDRTPLRPNGLYGVCKKALFEVTRSLAHDAGIGHAWARVFFCYGPGEHGSRLVPRILRSLEDGGEVPFHPATGVRDYLHVDDVAGAIAALAGSTHEGPINVGSGDPVTLRSFLEELAIAAGRPGAIAFGSQPAPSYEPARVVADTAVIRNALGWAPQIALDRGLKQTADEWRRGTGLPPEPA
jgi:nucleoside-diphosphate-sugar epimerase